MAEAITVRESAEAGNKQDLVKLAKHFKEMEYFKDYKLSDNTALKQVRMIWESISSEPNDSGVVNPEVLVHKEAALRFVESRVLELLRVRAAVLKEVDELRGLVVGLEQDIEKGGSPNPPADYKPWRLNGPQLFFHPDQFGEVNWENNSTEVQRIAKDMGLCEGQLYSDHVHWRQDRAWKRELNAVNAFNEFNEEYLEVKKEAWQAFANKLTEGADHLLVKYLRAAPMDYTKQFINKNFCLVEEDIKDAVIEDESLFYDGEGEDRHPRLGDEKVDIPYINIEVIQRV